MSNLIKYPFVNMQGKEKRVIQYETEEEKFVPLQQKKVLMKSLQEVEAEKKQEEAREAEKETAAATGEFAAGVPVTNFDEIFQQKSEEAEKEAETILARAREDAEKLLSEGKEQLDALREDARQEGIAQGREEGLRQGEEEASRLREELEEEKQRQDQEYRELIDQVEGNYVELVCSLVRKLTGEIVSDKQDVILHLIRSGIADMEPAQHYIIRVGSDDLLYIESNKEDIIEKTGITGTLEIQEEKALQRGACIIETDNQMIDCGFKTQLENLITTLRMIAQQ